MKHYGMPYKGSKSAIAWTIINALPPGARFVDLFGGGGAMTHVAALSGKYRSVLYNERLPLVAETFRKAIRGDYAPDKFTPWFVSHEDFFRYRATDGYVALCWSFGNDMSGYLWSREKEPLRRIIWDEYAKHGQFSRALRPVSAYERLESLGRLESPGRLPVDVRCGDYADVEYQEGDVVYCDPPYGSTMNRYYRVPKTGDGGEYNAGAFFDWCASRDYPVYVSGYEVPDERFAKILDVEKRVLSDPNSNSKVAREIVFTQARYATEPIIGSAEQIGMEF